MSEEDPLNWESDMWQR